MKYLIPYFYKNIKFFINFFENSFLVPPPPRDLFVSTSFYNFLNYGNKIYILFLLVYYEKTCE